MLSFLKPSPNPLFFDERKIWEITPDGCRYLGTVDEIASLEADIIIKKTDTKKFFSELLKKEVNGVKYFLMEVYAKTKYENIFTDKSKKEKIKVDLEIPWKYALKDDENVYVLEPEEEDLSKVKINCGEKYYFKIVNSYKTDDIYKSFLKTMSEISYNLLIKRNEAYLKLKEDVEELYEKFKSQPIELPNYRIKIYFLNENRVKAVKHIPEYILIDKTSRKKEKYKFPSTDIEVYINLEKYPIKKPHYSSVYFVDENYIHPFKSDYSELCMGNYSKSYLTKVPAIIGIVKLLNDAESVITNGYLPFTKPFVTLNDGIFKKYRLRE